MICSSGFRGSLLWIEERWRSEVNYKDNTIKKVIMVSLPAILGGKPVFEEKIQIVRPLLPPYSEIQDGIQEILKTGMVTRGRYLDAFERAIADHLDVRHAIAVSSCTAGLMLAYRALGLTGEVIVPSFTFMATVSSMIWCGLKPVFVDVDPDSTTLDPTLVEGAITPNTSAIVAVHNFGNPARIDSLKEIASRHKLKLIFDAAHGFGALYQGKPVGGQGDAQVFSMSPTKLLISGEGGVVTTNDDQVAKMVRIGREYGNDGSYDSIFAGLNARLPELSALMGLTSLNNLEQAALSRNQTAALFREQLENCPGIGFQEIHPGDRSSYREYSITVDPQKFGMSRDVLAEALLAENIDIRKYYDPPVHRQTAYRGYYDGQPLPHTDWLASQSLSLPMWSDMAPEITVKISAAILNLHEHAGSLRQGQS
jgi:dTDP-4-amino-4,6-dideoxygalactose transaminase